MSISEDQDGSVPDAEGWNDTGPDDTAAGFADTARSASPATKWGMAGLLLAYAGLGSYCFVSAVGHGPGPDRPQGVTRSVTTALGKSTAPAATTPAATTPTATAGAGTLLGGAAAAASTESAASSNAIITGKAYAAKAFTRVQAVTATPKAEALSAVSATAMGPVGGNGDHPKIAPLVLDGNSATAWVTHWYASAHFGNLKEGTGLVLDMGRAVTIQQVQLALGGSPGIWGADIQIRVGNSPEQWNFAPDVVATDVGGWVAPELPTPATGRYVQIWFTKLPRDSWGTYQEHVYGVTVHGSVPATTHTSHPGHPGGGHRSRGAHPARGPHSGDPHPGGGHHGGHGGGHGPGGPGR